MLTPVPACVLALEAFAVLVVTSAIEASTIPVTATRALPFVPKLPAVLMCPPEVSPERLVVRLDHFSNLSATDPLSKILSSCIERGYTSS